MNNVRLKAPEVQGATAKYEQQVIETMLQVVDEAVSGMRPAKMGYAYGKSFINVNRNQDYKYTDENGELKTECAIGFNSEAPVDRTLFILKFEDFEGQPIAFFMNYPVHNCVMHANQCCGSRMGISGDIAGNVSRFLEDQFEDCTAIWSSGAAGDVNPLMMNEIYYPDPKTGRANALQIHGGDTTILTALSSRHFADVKRAVRKIRCIADPAPIAGVVNWSYTPGKNMITSDDGKRQIIMGDDVDPMKSACIS